MAGPNDQRRGPRVRPIIWNRVHNPNKPSSDGWGMSSAWRTTAPRRLFYEELADGKRNKGRPKNIFKDSVKTNVQRCEIKQKELEECENNRDINGEITSTALQIEEARRQKTTAVRGQRHRPSAAVITSTDFQCLYCSSLCEFSLGL